MERLKEWKWAPIVTCSEDENNAEGLQLEPYKSNLKKLVLPLPLIGSLFFAKAGDME